MPHASSQRCPPNRGKANITDITNVIFNPINSWLTTNPTKRPQYVILFLDLPSRVVDPQWNYFPLGYYPIGTNVAEYPSVQCQIYSNCAAGWTPFVTSINMNGTNDCIGYISNKLVAFDTNNSLIISASSSGYGNTNYYIDDTRASPYSVEGIYAFTALLGIGVSSNCIDYLSGVGITSSNQQIISGTNVAGYFSWGAHSYLGPTYATDETVKFYGNSSWYLIRTVESFNGRRYETDMETFLGWFSDGAFGGTNYANAPIAAVSYVDEPGVSATDDSLYFPLWSQGKIFSACAWNSRNTPYFQAVGDPFVKQ